MRKLKSFTLIGLSFLCLFLSIHTNVYAQNQSSYPMGTENEIALRPSEELTFSVTYDGSNISGIAWENSDTSIATITSVGSSTTVRASGNNYGLARIVGSYPDPDDSDQVLTIRFNVNVLEGIAFSQSQIEIDFEQEIFVDVVTNPFAPIGEIDLTYTSQNPNIASVNAESGVITGLSEGTTQIIANYHDQFSATLTVRVTDIPDFRFTQSNLVMNLFSNVQAPYQLSVHGGRDSTITWESEDPEIATVDDNGWIRAEGVGTTNIRAIVLNQTYLLSLTVSSGVVDFRIEESNLRLETGSSYQLNYVIEPESQNQLGVTWTSSNPAVVAVSNGVVTARRAGSAIISGRVDNIVRQVSVEVLIPIENISVTPTRVVVAQDDYQMLSVIYKPSNTTVSKNPVFTSTDPSIATVTEDGIVVGETPGETTILIEDHGFSLTVPVEVTLRHEPDGKTVLEGEFQDADTVVFDTELIEDVSRVILEVPYMEAFDQIDDITLDVILNNVLVSNGALNADSLILNRQYLTKNISLRVSKENEQPIYSIQLNNFNQRRQNMFVEVSKDFDQIRKLSDSDWFISLPFAVNNEHDLVVYFNHEFTSETDLFLYQIVENELTDPMDARDEIMILEDGGMALSSLSSGNYLISSQNSDMILRDWPIYVVSTLAVIAVMGFVVYKIVEMRKKDKQEENEEFNIL